MDVPAWETDQTPGSKADDVMIYPWVNALIRLGEYAPGKRA